MATSPDYSPVCSPDTSGLSATSLDSLGPIPIGLGAATDLFCAAKAAEGASPRTVEWYQMILVRAVRQFGEARPVDRATNRVCSGCRTGAIRRRPLQLAREVPFVRFLRARIGA